MLIMVNNFSVANATDQVFQTNSKQLKGGSVRRITACGWSD